MGKTRTWGIPIMAPNVFIKCLVRKLPPKMEEKPPTAGASLLDV